MKGPTFSVTILADNAAAEPFEAEHGFSAWLETTPGTGGVLFDVGRGALIGNAAAAGVDLATVTDIVLSHGHYDHTDALPLAVSRAPNARIHASVGLFVGHWSSKTGEVKPIGLSEENRALLSETAGGVESRDTPVNFFPFRGETSVPGTPFRLTEGIPRVHPLETPAPLLHADPDGTVPDPIPEELSLWARTDEGLVIITGCCHSGLINTCERVRALSGETRIRAFLGGLHLAGVGRERLEATARYVLETGIGLLVPCHCTGSEETEWLRDRLGDRLEPGSCGMRLEF